MKEKITTEYDINVYFDFQAAVGLTKHIGGAKATDELIVLCHMAEGQRVLDVGCGVGTTTRYLVGHCGVHAVGVDLRPAMIDRARQYAREEHLSDWIEFHLADAQALPFEDNTFNAVICESVLAFVPDRPQALREFIRATQPGGYVGFTEAIWSREPSQELEDYMARIASPEAHLELSAVWESLLANSGLVDTVVRVYEGVTPLGDAKNQIRRMGWGRILSVWGRTFKVLFGNARYRAFISSVVKFPKEIVSMLGYGVYVGRKLTPL
jgi:ubiquinone/menaquinone biosynthesis C-methylase UbiE